MNNLMCVTEMEARAVALWDAQARAYYVEGSDDQITLSENRKAYDRFYIIPRYLVGLRNIDTSCRIFGKEYSMPIHCAPSAIQRLAHPEGEVGTAKACQDKNVIMCLSTLSSSSFQEIVDGSSSSATHWMQLYILRDRKKTLKQVKMAQAYNFEALVITIDAPVLGNRRSSKRLEIKNKPHIKYAMLNSLEDSKINDEDLVYHFFRQTDMSISWKDIKWLRSVTTMKIIVKGINSKADALMAVEAGCDAIWISNHGGRQLDTSPATIYLLPPIKRALGNSNIPIIIDGGVVSGMNAFKALALGADAVFVGRPVLWGLTLGGSSGVSKMLDIMHEELKRTMTLSGCSSIESIRKAEVVHKDSLSKL